MGEKEPRPLRDYIGVCGACIFLPPAWPPDGQVNTRDDEYLRDFNASTEPFFTFHIYIYICLQ